MKRVELSAALDPIRLEYFTFIDNQTGRKPVGFTKRQSADLKAGYADGLIQGALTALKVAGIPVED